MAISMRAARVNANLTLTEAAKLLGTSKNTLADYENGKRCPRVDTAKKMAEIYHMSVNDINFFEF